MKKIIITLSLVLASVCLSAQPHHPNYTRKGDVVYYGDKPVFDADAESFQSLGHGYGKDHYNVFFDGKLLEFVDAASFKLHGKPKIDKEPLVKTTPDDSYYIGKWDVCYRGEKLKDAVASSFVDLGQGYGKDKFNVYYQGRIIEGAIPSSFVVDKDGYSHDAFETYFHGRKVK